MHGVMLLTWFCKQLTRVAILSGGGTCLKCLNGTTPLAITVNALNVSWKLLNLNDCGVFLILGVSDTRFVAVERVEGFKCLSPAQCGWNLVGLLRISQTNNITKRCRFVFKLGRVLIHSLLLPFLLFVFRLIPLSIIPFTFPLLKAAIGGLGPLCSASAVSSLVYFTEGNRG